MSQRLGVHAGARQIEAGLDLHIRWADGFDAWIFHSHLKERPHCLLKLVNFYESKTRRKARSPPQQQPRGSERGHGQGETASVNFKQQINDRQDTMRGLLQHIQIALCMLHCRWFIRRGLSAFLSRSQLDPGEEQASTVAPCPCLAAARADDVMMCRSPAEDKRGKASWTDMRLNPRTCGIMHARTQDQWLI